MQQSFKVYVGYKIKSRKSNKNRQGKPMVAKIDPFDRIHEVIIDETIDPFNIEPVNNFKVS